MEAQRLNQSLTYSPRVVGITDHIKPLLIELLNHSDTTGQTE